MSTVSTILNFSRTQAQTDSNGLTDAKGLIWANEALLDYRRQLIAAGVDASQLQEAYRDGTVGTGTYLYPTDMFWLKSIELNYTDTNPQNYLPATQVDVSNLSGNMSFSWLRQNASTTAPQFDDRGDWFEIFPTPTSSTSVSQLIRIFYFLEPTEYSAVSDTVSYPENLDYRTLGWRICSNYYYSLGKFNEGDMFNGRYQQRVDEIIATLSRGTQMPLQATPIPLSGWEF